MATKLGASVDISTILAKTFDLKARTQANRSAPFLKWLPKRAYAGKAIDWKVYGPGRTAAAFASGADAPSSSDDVPLAPTLSWARYHTTIEIAFDALIAAINAPNRDQAVQDLFEDEVMQAAGVIANTIETALFAGDGTSNAIAGVGIGIDAATTGNDYAGIDVSTYTSWVSTEYGTAGSELAMTLPTFATFHQNMFTTFGAPLANEAGDAWWTTPANYAKFQGLLGANPYQIVNQGGVALQGGASSLGFDGVPVFRSQKCTTDTLYGVRRANVEFRFMPVMQVNGMPLQNSRDMVAGPLGAEEPTEVMFHFNELGRSGAAVKYQVWVQCQLVVRDRIAHGVWHVDTDGTA